MMMIRIDGKGLSSISNSQTFLTTHGTQRSPVPFSESKRPWLDTRPPSTFTEVSTTKVCDQFASLEPSHPSPARSLLATDHRPKTHANAENLRDSYKLK